MKELARVRPQIHLLGAEHSTELLNAAVDAGEDLAKILSIQDEKEVLQKGKMATLAQYPELCQVMATKITHQYQSSKGYSNLTRYLEQNDTQKIVEDGEDMKHTLENAPTTRIGGRGAKAGAKPRNAEKE